MRNDQEIWPSQHFTGNTLFLYWNSPLMLDHSLQSIQCNDSVVWPLIPRASSFVDSAPGHYLLWTKSSYLSLQSIWMVSENQYHIIVTCNVGFKTVNCILLLSTIRWCCKTNHFLFFNPLTLDALFSKNWFYFLMFIPNIIFLLETGPMQCILGQHCRCWWPGILAPMYQ